MEENMIEVSFFAMECNDCGWDWISNFIVCVNCGSSNTSLIEEINDAKMFDRLYWMNLKTIKGFFDPSIAIKEVNKMFSQGWERK